MNDAGGAHQIASYLAFNKFFFNAVLTGPAVKIFREYKLNFNNFKKVELKKKIKNSDLIISGSGWQTNLEKKAIYFSNLYKKKSVTILDHWSNYNKRFIFNNNKNLPKEIWTNNQYSKNLLKSDKFFKKTKIKIIKNYYKHHVIQNSIKKKIKNNNVLLNCEPFIKSINGFSTNDLIRSFTQYLYKRKIKINLNIRLHPSQKKITLKLDNKIKKKINIKISKKSLIEDLSNAGIVVGCDSYALVVSTWVRKKTFYFFPNKNKKTTLPIKNIFNFRRKFNNLKFN